jgi:hypothetical protein
MKSSDIFEVCHSRYKSLRGYLKDATGHVKSLGVEAASEGYRWRPSRARACEYVADFERIGRNALRRPQWEGRLRVFETYFLGGLEYRRAIRLVGVAEGTFDYWFQEVKRTLGAEYRRTGLFPPFSYFHACNRCLAASARSETFTANAAPGANSLNTNENAQMGIAESEQS